MVYCYIFIRFVCLKASPLSISSSSSQRGSNYLGIVIFGNKGVTVGPCVSCHLLISNRCDTVAKLKSIRSTFFVCSVHFNKALGKGRLSVVCNWSSSGLLWYFCFCLIFFTEQTQVILPGKSSIGNELNSLLSDLLLFIFGVKKVMSH